eukprot:COSAG01_NODE_17905_length_1115_cov_1.334646_2_plen_219_part_01
MDIVYLNEGLTQTRNAKLYFKKMPKQIKNVERHIILNLPLFMTIPVWRRHNYSLSDIRLTLSDFNALHLWQCALLLGIAASNSAIKLAFSTPESMVYGSKAIVINKIQKLLKTNYNFNDDNPSTLDTKRDDHVPPLPIHKLSVTDYHFLKSILPSTMPKLMEVVEYRNYFSWKDIKIVPLWKDKEDLYCVRIVPLTTFENSRSVNFKTHKALCHRPLTV